MDLYENRYKLHKVILIIIILYSLMLSAIAQNQPVELIVGGLGSPYYDELSEDILQFKLTVWHYEETNDPRPATNILVNWHIEGSNSPGGEWHYIPLTPTGPNKVREIIEELYTEGKPRMLDQFPKTLYNHKDKMPGIEGFTLDGYNLLGEWHISRIPPKCVAALRVIIKTDRKYKYYRQVVDDYEIILPSSDIIRGPTINIPLESVELPQKVEPETPKKLEPDKSKCPEGASDCFYCGELEHGGVPCSKSNKCSGDNGVACRTWAYTWECYCPYWDYATP